MPYPTMTSSWATPSWISRASRCRSSFVASERTSSKSSAASSRSAAGPVSAVTRDTTGGGYAAAVSASITTRPTVRTPATSGTISAETSPECRDRACDRDETVGCWLAQASAMAESASSVVSQSTRSAPIWASTTSRPPPLAESTAPRSVFATTRSSSSRCSEMPPGSSVAPGSWRATVRSWVSSRVASAYGWGLPSPRTRITRWSVPAV